MHNNTIVIDEFPQLGGERLGLFAYLMVYPPINMLLYVLILAVILFLVKMGV